MVLIHSLNDLEQDYLNLTDDIAGEGYVVIAPKWQTFNRTSRDEVQEQLNLDAAAYLTRLDVDTSRIGLTGFCAGERYTVLFLPQIAEFRQGVAWYGSPYSGGFVNQSKPADMIAQLNAPLLMIHGTHDHYSSIADIRHANASSKYFELKVLWSTPMDSR